LLNCALSPANAAFEIVVSTKTSSSTLVNGQPAKLVEKPSEASSSSTGTELSMCQPYGRQSTASAVARARRTAKTIGSVDLTLSSSVVATGGHFRSCFECLGRICVGITGNDTSAEAEAQATAVVLVKFDDQTIPGMYRIRVRESRRGSADSTSVEVKDAAGATVSPESANNFVVQGKPGAVYRVEASASARAADKGMCCKKSGATDLEFGVDVERLAEIATQLTPYVLGGSFTKEYPQVGVITLQQLNGTTLPHCTGTLIGKVTVLTAAHCVADTALRLAIEQKRMRFVLGSTLDDSSAERFVITAAPFPQASPFKFSVQTAANGDITTEDDVAVAYLDKPAKLEPLPIYRGTAPTLQKLIDTVEPVPFVGFGLFSIASDGTLGSGSGKKRQAFVPISGQDARTFAFKVNDQGQGACKGDSGGPALVETPPNGWRVLGVTAYGAKNCQTGRSMRVDAFAAWIAPLIKN
jgi:secreted trypsin-like serine protease